MGLHTDHTEPPLPSPQAGVAGIEEALRQILQAVRDGQDDRVGPLVERLGEMVESLGQAGMAGAAILGDLHRVRDLWKQACLALASAGQHAGAELQRIAAGREIRRAYRG